MELYFGSSAKVWEDISWIYGIEDAGYTGWEVCADGKYHFSRPDQYRNVIETLATTNLKVTVHAPYGDLNPAAINEPIWKETVRQISECIIKASEITSRVTIHPGYFSCTGKLVPGKIWELQKEALRVFGRTGQECGVVPCIENMPGIPDFLCQYPEEILGLIEGIEGIGLTIDFGHANTIGKVDAFRKYLSEASHVHIHDNKGKSDEHLPIGAGTIDWKSLSRDLSSQYNGVIVVEGRSIPEAKLSMQQIRGWTS
ncbi:MAG TPA: sugar phosphate isomerase/epimerase family protein [Methanospirillum sp.]|nr:sugar phosphate isomerase/epimerase family protein [Methanospirillum sp.]